jgi:hypothetical protein
MAQLPSKKDEIFEEVKRVTEALKSSDSWLSVTFRVVGGELVMNKNTCNFKRSDFLFALAAFAKACAEDQELAVPPRLPDTPLPSAPNTCQDAGAADTFSHLPFPGVIQESTKDLDLDASESEVDDDDDCAEDEWEDDGEDND